MVPFMVRRRRLLLRVGAVVLLGLAGFALLLWLTSPVPGVVSWENYRRLRIGMSSSEVEALLGTPQDALPTRDLRYNVWQELRVWHGFRCSLTFTEEGRLLDGGCDHEGVVYGILTDADETFLERIRRLLHW